MKVDKVNGITIYYDDKVDIFYIKKVIKNNYWLIKNFYPRMKSISLTKLKQKNTFYISNFDKFFYEIVQAEFFKDSIKKELMSLEVLRSLGIEFRVLNHDDWLVKPSRNISLEQLLDMAAFRYFTIKGTKEDFIDYLKNRKQNEEVIEFIKDETRFLIYNHFLKITINTIREHEPNFLDKIVAITDEIINQAGNDILEDLSIPEEKEKIDLKKIEQLFLGFLDFINAPNSWKELYQDLKKNKQITYFNSDTSNCFFDENNNLKIDIDEDSEIDVFYALVHEFIHAITFVNKQYTNFFLAEFPSIFFEKIVVLYLQKINYPNKQSLKIINRRIKNNLDIYLEFGSIYTDLLSYLNGKEITEENEAKELEDLRKKIESLMNDQNQDENTREKFHNFYDLTSKYPSFELVKDKYDMLINIFLTQGMKVLDGYKYLLGTILASTIINQDLNVVIPKMIYIAEHLDSYNIEDILKEFKIKSLQEKLIK